MFLKKYFCFQISLVAFLFLCFSIQTNALELEIKDNDSPLYELLPPKILGDENAPVTIYEFSAVTCNFCAAFHTNTLPELKKNYIDSGIVRLIYYDFPLGSSVGLAISMIPHCTNNKDLYFRLLDGIFKSQSSWIRSANPSIEIQKLASLVGMNEESVQECLNNKELMTTILDKAQKAKNELGVSSTPTFFISKEGELWPDKKELLFVGYKPFTDFKNAINNLLKE